MRPLVSGALYLAAVGAGSAMVVTGSRNLAIYSVASLDLEPASKRPLSRVERQLLVQGQPLDSQPKPLRRIAALTPPRLPAAVLAMQMDHTEHARETALETPAAPLVSGPTKLAVLTDVAPVRIREWVRVVPVVRATEVKKTRKLRLARTVPACSKRKALCQAQKRVAGAMRPAAKPQFDIVFDPPKLGARRVHIAETPGQLMSKGLLGGRS